MGLWTILFATGAFGIWLANPSKAGLWSFLAHTSFNLNVLWIQSLLMMRCCQKYRMLQIWSKFLFFFRSEGAKIGSALNGASVSALLGLAASSLGIISFESPAYSILLEFLFPLTIPLLLFRADLRRVFTSTGIFLLAFLIGTGKNQIFFF